MLVASLDPGDKLVKVYPHIPLFGIGIHVWVFQSQMIHIKWMLGVGASLSSKVHGA